MNELLSKSHNYWQYGWNAPSWFGPLVLVAVIWTLIWKGMAMWRAAQKGDKGWFVLLLIVNTLGILDILYLYVFSRKAKQPQVNQ